MQSVCVVSATMTYLPKFHTLLSHAYKHTKIDALRSMHRTHTHTHTHSLLLRVFEHVDACEDLECRSQFNVHGAHEVVLL